MLGVQGKVGEAMKEGELYIRIAEIIRNIDQPKYDPRQISDVLDEAAKEYPNPDDEKYKDRDIPLFSSQKNGDYYKFKYDEYINDCLLWKKKWLGEQP